MTAPMNRDIYAEVTHRIEADFGFKQPSGAWYQGGKCPSCGKPGLFANKDNPLVIKCGRTEKCGAVLYAKELYPELFDNWGKRYPKTTECPNAAADAYLREACGFNLELIGDAYIQEAYYDAVKKIGSTTIRFPLDNGHYWERLIDQPQQFGNKWELFSKGSSYSGTAWKPPCTMPIDEIWIVKGIFDSIALMHHGIWAAAAMSSKNYPHSLLTAVIEQCEAAEQKRPKLVWALDGDADSTTHTKLFVERSRSEGWDASAAVIRQQGRTKRGWNDLHMADSLNAKDIDDCRYRGRLLTAKSAADKANVMNKQKQWSMFYFDFDNRLYWFEYDVVKYNAEYKKIAEENESGLDHDQISEKALEASRSVRQIANCLPTALYYQANELTDEQWYYLRVDFPHDGPSVKNTFTGTQVRSAGEFSKRLISIAPGALYTGSQLHLDLWLEKQMFAIKTVKTIDYIGYSREHGAWVFDDIAIKDGRVHELNEEDYFDIGKMAIKSLNRSVNLAINPDLKEYDPEWAKLLWYCFKQKGIVCLAFWLGSLFAEQIRDLQESYPFIEIVGDPGAGKSTIIEFLWRLCGRTQYEGFDPQKATIAARARNFAQVSNLPIVLIESDRDSGDDKNPKQKGFDWDELKTAYNGRSVRSTGVKNSGNDTREPPFRGAIVISQNATVTASDAFMQRLMHVHFELQPHTEASREAFQRLARYPVQQVSGFILHATRAEAAILKTVSERTPVHEQTLDANPNVKHFRIIKNHAQLMALVDALAHVIEMRDETVASVHAEIVRMAEERQHTINDDHPRIQEFWEVVDFIESKDDTTPLLNHSRDEKRIAINLNEFVAKADAFRQQIPDMREIKKLLRTSRERKFVEANAAINSAIYPGKTIKAWIFEKPGK